MRVALCPLSVAIKVNADDIRSLSDLDRLAYKGYQVLRLLVSLNVSLSGKISNARKFNYSARKKWRNIMANAKKNQVSTNANTKVLETLATLKAEVETTRKALQVSADKRNEARMNEDLQEVEICKANARELEKACAKACKAAAFYELAFCNAELGAMKAAIKAKSYMTYVLKDNKDSDTDTITCEVETKEVFISLKEMDTYCTTHGVKGSVNKDWSGEFMALSGAIVAQVVLGFTDAEKRDATIKALKTDYDFSKALVKHEKALENADLADPTSKNQVKKLGQTVVEHLVGNGYVFKDTDYEFLKANVTAYDKRTQKVGVLASRDLYNLNNKVFQHIVYGVPYELKSKKN